MVRKIFVIVVFLLFQLRNVAQTKDFHQWASTPPMGWNSWDCFGPTVTEKEVKANADYMAKYLKPYGWNYIIVDIRWYVGNDKAHGYNEKDPDYVLDEYGRFMPAVNRFPSAAGGKGFKPLADYIHSKGLKFGIHIMRGIPVVAVQRNLKIKGTKVTARDIYSDKDQCKWLHDMYTIVPGKAGSQEYYNSLFELYASWGLDFVKVDDLSAPTYFAAEIEMIRKAIDRAGRKIVLSTSPGETPIAQAAHVQSHANMWRTVDDFWDNWKHLKEHFEVFKRWNQWRSFGAYPDGDMLPLGRIGIRAERGNPRMTNFTKDEQYTLMTLWCIFKSPLMFGGNLPDNDSFTLSLLTNKRVLEVLNRSINNRLLFMDENKAAWIADEPRTGARYLAVFNIADPKDGSSTVSSGSKIPVSLETLGFSSAVNITDLWSGKPVGRLSGEFAPEINRHGAGLYKIEPLKSNEIKLKAAKENYTAYLFTYFTGNAKAEEQICFAISKDGYNYRSLNNGKPVIQSSAISETGGVRDPHILRGADGKTFYMVVTDMVSANGWSSNRAMVLLKSTDLINWTSSVVNIQKRFAEQDSLLRVWAPQTIYDATAKKYMIYFSMKHGNQPDKIYYAYANKDFTDLEAEPKQLFYSPDNAACIDGDIAEKDGRFYLFFKTEDRHPGIKIAVSDKLTGGYQMQSPDYVQQTKSPVEGAGTFKLNDGSGHILMYDMYTSGRYQFTKTKDLKTFTVVDEEVSMNFHPRHGTVMSITAAEAERLMKKWVAAEDVLGNATAKQIKKINTRVDTLNKTVYLSVKPGTNLKAFNPSFRILPATTVTPAAAQDFSKGAVKYVVNIKGQQPQAWKVIAQENHNPVLEGYFADPDVLYSEKTKKYYIYPTSDGFNGWSGTYFKAFSSADLVNWKDEGVILDLNKDVSWAKRNAWAPCIIEKKVNGQYKCFYYFTAAQKIGVAVADDPAGPFVDMGKALIDKKTEGVRGGQEIDPEVFTDPQTGKSYLYWGNGYMAVAELNEDMISLKQETLSTIKVDRTFREGTTVFYRKGIYYFLWSEDDTRSENYRVRYGTSNSPTGPITIAENNLVIAKDPSTGIYGTGHNSILQIPGTDEWYIVYHRFNYPKGITMGSAAGFNREVCIDKMEFNADGSIKLVKPTHEGVKALK